MELSPIKIIGNIENLETLLSKPSYDFFSMYFKTYRKIGFYSQNLLSALAVGIFDLSTIQNINEIVIYLNSYRNKHDSQYTPDEKISIVTALTQIYNNIISDESLEQKVEKLNSIYTTSISSLNLLIRECAIYSAITQYNNPKYSEYSSKMPFDAYFLKLFDRSSQLSFEDLEMFIDTFFLHVHIINPNTYDVCEINPNGKYSIFFLEFPEGYYSLQTKDMYSIIVDSQIHRNHIKIQYIKFNIVTDSEEVYMKYRTEMEKRGNSAKEFTYVVNSLFKNMTISNIKNQIDINADLSNALIGFYCQYCGKFTECYKLSCGHFFCENEFNYMIQISKLCIICGNDLSSDINNIYMNN